MSVLEFSAIVFFIACFAGLVGALTGLGGGMIIIPVLVLGFHTDIHYAMGASLISVIATSSGAAIAYLREGYTNVRVGMFLETAAVIGAFFGALLVALFPTSLLAITLGLVLMLSAYLAWKRKEEFDLQRTGHPWATAMQLHGSYPSLEGKRSYQVHNVFLAWCVMGVAGILSGLLGIGSGALKVIAMDQVMRLPYKVATTTSNFIIGITAAVGAGVYFSRGYINPLLTFPVVLGVTIGALIGARILMRLHSQILRVIFSIIIIFLAIEMVYKGISGNL